MKKKWFPVILKKIIAIPFKGMTYFDKVNELELYIVGRMM